MFTKIMDLKKQKYNKTIILLPEETPPSLKEKAPGRTLFDGTNIYINNQVQIKDMTSILNVANALGFNIDVV